MKYFDRQFIKEDIQLSNKYVAKCSILFVIREIKSYTIVHSITTHLPGCLDIRILAISVGGGYEEQELFSEFDGIVN